LKSELQRETSPAQLHVSDEKGMVVSDDGADAGLVPTTSVREAFHLSDEVDEDFDDPCMFLAHVAGRFPEDEFLTLRFICK